MKRMYILLALIAVVAVGFVLGQDYFSNSFIVENEQKEVIVEKEVEVDSIEKRIKEAQAEAMADIEAEANQMRDEFVATRLDEVESEVLGEIQSELKARQVETDKRTGAFWRSEENIKAYIRQVFYEDPSTAIQVAYMESQLRMVQSNHVYTASNVPAGHSVGSRENSFCIYQIHKPAHHQTAVRLGLDDYATNVESCVKMARVVYDQAGGSFSPWSVYKNILAMR